MVMKNVNRLVLSGLLVLSVTGGTLAPAVAGHAAAGGRGGLCPPPDACPWIETATPTGSVVDGALSGGVVMRDGGARGGVVMGESRPGIVDDANVDGKAAGASGVNF